MGKMDLYFVNRNGNHEVHKESCYWHSIAKESYYLGTFDTCQEAVAKARQLGYGRSNGCMHCSPSCNTRQRG